ncbi:hypothetical protein AAMO2058_000526200 [Amorphochlora amoebiformis]
MHLGQFVYRAERHSHFRTPAETDSLAAIGPGTYDVGQNRLRPNASPFLTSSSRNMQEYPYSTVPGPGEYDAGKKKQLSMGRAVFKSRSRRFARRSDVPGPGSYEIKKQWLKDVRSRNAAFGGSDETPTIPSKNHRYGYSPGSNGELVLKRAPRDLHTGTKDDCVAPDEYFVKDDLIHNRNPSYSFGHSRSLKGLSFSHDYSPGPGSYFAVPSNIKGRGANSLQSSTNRFSNPETIGPGPAAYHTVQAAERLNKRIDPVARNNYLGGTSKKPPLWLNQDITPGPGYYDKPVESHRFRTMKKLAQKKKAAPAPFSSTSNRFGKEIAYAPGPGEHQKSHRNSTFVRKSYGRNASFGNTSTRFGRADGAESSPGPGSYSLIHSKKNFTAQPGTFGSVAKRFQSSETLSPAPGSYNPSLPAHNRHSRGLSGVFRSCTVRGFQGNGHEGDPGPGSYKYYNPRNKRNGFRFTKDPRFNDMDNHHPGPGSHDATSPILSKSNYEFNITYD